MFNGDTILVKLSPNVSEEKLLSSNMSVREPARVDDEKGNLSPVVLYQTWVLLLLKYREIIVTECI